MFQILRVFFIGLALTVCASSVLRLVSIGQYKKTIIPEVAQGLSGERQYKPNPKVQQGDFERVLKDQFSSFDERSKVAVKYAELAENSTDTSEKINYLCQTLAALSAALEKEPLRARSLVTWANVRQLLGSYSCPNDKTKYYEAALELAHKSDPLDQQALFNSALVFLWAQKLDKAYPLFKKVLELGTDSTGLQRDYIYSLAKDASSLQALIPARLPQAIEFLNYYLKQPSSSAVRSISKTSFWEFQASALKEFANRYEQNLINADLYAEWVYNFWKLSRNSAVTPAADALLAKHYIQRGQMELAAFFSSRSRYTELEIVTGLKPADSRPEKTSLFNWAYAGDVSVDEFFSSVGFYLPRKSTLRRIELHSNIRRAQGIASLIQILQSDDNSSWEDVTGISTINQVGLPGRSVLYIELPGSTKRFWKVHYASPARNHLFTGSLSSMLRAFGVGSLNG